MKKFVILSSLILSACVTINSTFLLVNHKIAGRVWRVDKNETNLPKSATLILGKNRKNGGKFSGFGGCNNYNGIYLLTNYSIKFKLKMIDKKRCPNFKKEQNFLSNLLLTHRMYIKGNRLILSSKEHSDLMKLGD